MGQEVTSEVTVNDTLISQLAREIARNILPTDTVLKKFKLDTKTYERVFDLPYFQRRLEEELSVWNGSDVHSIRTRIAAKAATVIEESMIEVYDLIHDKSQPLSGKVEMLKHCARLANMEGGAALSDADAQVVINISFGGNTMTFEKERVPPTIDVVPTVEQEPLP
jgi:hypothetical protein